ncbi:hypothetical protein Tco_0503764 [Tanacetum coccineum]
MLSYDMFDIKDSQHYVMRPGELQPTVVSLETQEKLLELPKWYGVSNLCVAVSAIQCLECECDAEDSVDTRERKSGVCVKIVGVTKVVLLGLESVPLLPLVVDETTVGCTRGRPFLSTAHAKIDVFKIKITLKVGDDKIMFKSDKPISNIIKRVYALGLRERMGWSPTYGDYIKVNDLNEPLELRRNQVEDLGPTIKDGAVIDKPMIEVTKTRNDDKEIEGIDEYLGFCDFDRKIHMDRAYNLQFSCMIVVENMDAYRDEGMGDVIVGKPFC